MLKTALLFVNKNSSLFVLIPVDVGLNLGRGKFPAKS